MASKMKNSSAQPLEDSTTRYLTEVARIHGNNLSMKEIERKLLNFTSTSNNIYDIYNEVVSLQNSLPPEIMPDRQKDRNLRHIFEAHCPESVKTILSESWITINHNQPTRELLLNFLTRHSETINNYLKYKRNKGIHQTSTADTSSITRSDVNTHQEYESAFSYHNYSDSEKSDGEEEEQSIHKVNQPKQFSKKAQESLTRKCTICKRLGHFDSQCFRHPDLKVALQNQQRRNISLCMLCSASTHLSPSCPIYPGMVPSYEPCSTCTESGDYERYHPTTKCKQGQLKQKEKD